MAGHLRSAVDDKSKDTQMGSYLGDKMQTNSETMNSIKAEESV